MKAVIYTKDIIKDFCHVIPTKRFQHASAPGGRRRGTKLKKKDIKFLSPYDPFPYVTAIITL